MDRTQVTRLPERARSDEQELHALLDVVPLAHIGLVAHDSPVVIPTAMARDGDRLLVHGSTGSGWMRRLAEGRDACVAVTAVDAVVVARSSFESSYRYRSAVLFGRFVPVADSEKERALEVLVERLIPGRVAEVRASTTKELAATLVLSMPISEWSLKVSDGWPEDGEEDVAGPAWAGVVPISTVHGPALAAPDLRAGIEVPPSVLAMLGHPERPTTP